MKVKVLVAFHDINNFRTVHREGDVCEFDDSRCERLVSLGYAEYVDAPKADEVVESPSEEAPAATSEEEEPVEETHEEAEKPAVRRGRKPKTEE